MEILRTPEERFAGLVDYPFKPHYAQLGELRLHYLDEGPAGADPILLMHGEPTWSFLYRHIIPPLVKAGHRVVAPDLIGCGRSDKPARQEDYSYQRHVDWMVEWLEKIDLHNITLFCQDWGSLIGLRMVTARPDRFKGVMLANGGLPDGQGKPNLAFALWQRFAKITPWMSPAFIVNLGSRTKLSSQVKAAYNAPFPNESYKAAIRVFPALVPIKYDDPGAIANRQAWQVLQSWEKPFMTAYSDGDPITRGADKLFQERVPGAKGQPHVILKGGGHFLQEDLSQELTTIIMDFVARNYKLSDAATR